MVGRLVEIKTALLSQKAASIAFPDPTSASLHLASSAMSNRRSRVHCSELPALDQPRMKASRIWHTDHFSEMG